MELAEIDFSGELQKHLPSNQPPRKDNRYVDIERVEYMPKRHLSQQEQIARYRKHLPKTHMSSRAAVQQKMKIYDNSPVFQRFSKDRPQPFSIPTQADPSQIFEEYVSLAGEPSSQQLDAAASGAAQAQECSLLSSKPAVELSQIVDPEFKESIQSPSYQKAE